ncbi:MAG: DUF4168 domain-containing protein [bacterium]
MEFTKKITSILVIILFFVPGVFAQAEQEISDKEMKQFATIIQEVAAINQQTQQKMISTLEEEGFEVQRFNEIIQAQQDPTKEIELKEGEKKKFEDANRKLGEIQDKAQVKMEEKIVDEGLTVNRYQEIAALVQSNPELQQKLQEYLPGTS